MTAQNRNYTKNQMDSKRFRGTLKENNERVSIDITTGNSQTNANS